MTTSEAAQQKSCWGHYQLEPGALGRWRIGPLDLWVRRTTLDWRYGFERGGDTLESTLEVQVPFDECASPETPPEEAARFGCRRTEANLELLPVLADRPVVARPSVPFFIPPGQQLELFVSTPVWVRLRSGATDLMELPCVRPSDTWFGTNTSGELSYATKTHMRRNLESLPQRPHRAVTAMTVINASKEQLPVRRLSIPVPQLSLYQARGGTLFTQHMLLRWEEGGDLTEVTLGTEAPVQAKGGKLLAEPRAPLGRSFASLVFGGLFESGY
ncbi:MAG: hypothetical protein P1V81_08930 [Planctomycetota bacterium]|nr:hypothetical protein [Planctomycetota bacterium]